MTTLSMRGGEDGTRLVRAAGPERPAGTHPETDPGADPRPDPAGAGDGVLRQGVYQPRPADNSKTRAAGAAVEEGTRPEAATDRGPARAAEAAEDFTGHHQTDL